MQQLEYRVVPAPQRGEKARGVKTVPERFALALTSLMNTLGREGWEYLRADALPCEERSGLTGTKVQFQNMLVFRRTLGTDADLPAEAEAVFTAPQVNPPLPPAPPILREPGIPGAAPLPVVPDRGPPED